MTILRLTPQMPDVLHRHEVLQHELVDNLSALRDGAQYRRASLAAVVQVLDQGGSVCQSNAGSKLQLLHELLVRHAVRQNRLNFCSSKPRSGELIFLRVELRVGHRKKCHVGHELLEVWSLNFGWIA